MAEDYDSDWTVTTRLARVNDIQVVKARRRNGRHARWSRAAGDHAPLCGGQRDQAALRRGGEQRGPRPSWPPPGRIICERHRPHISQTSISTNDICSVIKK